MDLSNVPTKDLELELSRRQKAETCSCQHFTPPSQREPGKHKPYCDNNPAYRPGDWS